jgi:hypothetical protein
MHQRESVTFDTNSIGAGGLYGQRAFGSNTEFP